MSKHPPATLLMTPYLAKHRTAQWKVAIEQAFYHRGIAEDQLAVAVAVIHVGLFRYHSKIGGEFRRPSAITAKNQNRSRPQGKQQAATELSHCRLSVPIWEEAANDVRRCVHGVPRQK